MWKDEIELAVDCLVTFKSCTCLIVLAQERECLHLCVPRLVHNKVLEKILVFSPKVNLLSCFTKVKYCAVLACYDVTLTAL